VTTREPDAFSVLRLRLVLDENTRRRLDAAMAAVGHLERGLTQWSLSNLEAMRRTSRWRETCAMPAGLSTTGSVTGQGARKVRNAALIELRREFHLTEYDFKAQILELRRDSKWICDHVPSSSALVHAAQVWESFAAHLFHGAGRPKVPRPWSNRVLQGCVRDAGRGAPTNEETVKAEAAAKLPPPGHVRPAGAASPCAAPWRTGTSRSSCTHRTIGAAVWKSR